jgi:hypothetical protein
MASHPDVNIIIKVITLPNSCYTALYWSRTLLYYILLPTCTYIIPTSLGMYM